MASMMAIVSGVVCVVMGSLRLGFIAELLSKPIRYGYMNGTALAVLISQLPKPFAISIEEQGPLRDLVSLAQAIAVGRANWASFAVGVASLMLILFLTRFGKLPGILVAVVLATLCVSVFGLDGLGVKVLGKVPQGLHMAGYRPTIEPPTAADTAFHAKGRSGYESDAGVKPMGLVEPSR